MSQAPRSSQHGWKRTRQPSFFRLFLRLKPSKRATKNLLVACVGLLALGSLVALASIAWISRDLPDPNSLTERSIPQSTKIYDRTGEHLLYEIHGDENRTLVKLQEGFCKDNTKMELDSNGIPLKLLQAIIAAEDRGFCNHGGFSAKGLIRAVVFGGSRGGGSTLTQQLVRNTLITNERTITRKAKELILSVELERRYSKDEILQIYFNEVGFGSSYYGVQAAAQNYFGKTVNELSIAQLATLAALPNGPTLFLNNPDLLKERRDWILNGMKEEGFITEEEERSAVAEDTSIKVKLADITAPHFVFYVKDELEQRYGARRVEEGGLKVITSLDYDKQLAAETAVTEGVEARGENYQFTNAALVSMDPKTGQILAMVGSKDYFDDEIDGQVNVALRPRQPGSSFKPIVYTKGFASGYTPNTILWDVKTNFGTETGNYSPNNYDLGERGPIRARDALQGSLNIPAVEMLYLVGVQNALDFAELLGYSTLADRQNFGLAVVLGGAEVKLLDHTNAYATFANEGVRHAPVSVLRVEEGSGSVLEEWKETPGEAVIDPNVTRMTSNVLSDNGARAYVFGPSSYLQLGDRPVAAKTGTTNDYHDAWTMGYTPSLVTGVWVGNNNNDAMKRGADGSIIAAPIWNAYMKAALKDTPIESFTAPAIPLTGKAALDGQIPSTTVTVDRASGKLATEFTPPNYREERTYTEYHTILHYVDRTNPTGPVPEDPTKDPAYASWEAGVQDWIRRQEEATGVKITNASAPTEYDDVHTLDNAPSVSVENMSDGEMLSAREFSVAVSASAPRGVARVEALMDGTYLGSDQNEPFSLSLTIPGSISRGYHTLTITAYDDVGNNASDTVGVRVESDASATALEISDPKNGQTIERVNETYPIVVSLARAEDWSNVIVSAERLGGGDHTLVGEMQNPNGPYLTFPWQLPASGEWVLSVSGDAQNGGGRLFGGSIVVRITEAPKAGAEGETLPTEGGTTPAIVVTPITTPLNPFPKKTP